MADMSEHPNAALVRPAWTAWAAGDESLLPSIWAADAVYHAPGNNRLFTGEHVGRDAVIAMLARTRPSVDSYECELVDVLGSDDHVTAWLQVTAHKGAAKIEYRNLITMRMRDGLVTEAWGNYSPQAETDRFQALPRGEGADVGG
jgi:ketosteroid isomerase-like protein